jgi:hypothetical protein
MKKFLATFVMMALMAIVIPFATATTANAQVSGYKKPSVYKRHRNLINIGIGAGAGALLGGLIGGKKGAAWGALAGGGAGAAYTYKINPKTKKYYRVYR